jgi:hypothetical protein
MPARRQATAAAAAAAVADSHHHGCGDVGHDVARQRRVNEGQPQHVEAVHLCLQLTEATQ